MKTIQSTYHKKRTRKAATLISFLCMLYICCYFKWYIVGIIPWVLTSAPGFYLMEFSNLLKGKMSRTWIIYNKPDEPNVIHAGLLLALGLHGHLRVLTITDIYQYYSQVFCPFNLLLQYLLLFKLLLPRNWELLHIGSGYLIIELVLDKNQYLVLFQTGTEPFEGLRGSGDGSTHIF